MQLLSFHLCISIAIRVTRISRGRNFHCKLLFRWSRQGVSEIAPSLQAGAQRDSQGQVVISIIFKSQLQWGGFLGCWEDKEEPLNQTGTQRIRGTLSVGNVKAAENPKSERSSPSYPGNSKHYQ